jgi:hypothetical protein
MIATAGRNILKQSRSYGRGLSATGLLFQATLKSKSATKSSIRFLSSNAAAKQPAHVALAEVLSGEILHEQGEVEIDEDYDEIKALISKSFKITDTPGYGSVTLERAYKGEQIVVTFDCQDVAEDVQDESQYHDFENQAESQIEQPGDENEEFEPPPSRFGINFEVAITKNKAKTIFYCSSVEDRVVIQNVTFVPEGLEEAKAYSGPKYEDLDPSVRDGFQNYLAERKIDEDFAFYILSEARNKEEREYRNWLANLVEFYSK